MKVESLSIDPKSEKPSEVFKLMLGLIGPRPIGWISTISDKGVPNLAPFSFFNMVSNNPPILAFVPAISRDGRIKDSLLNAKETKCFVHNLATKDLAESLNLTSTEFPYGVSEFEKVGLTPLASEVVKAPRVKEAWASLECEVRQILSMGDKSGNGQIIFGEVVRIHIHRKEILDENRLVNSQKLPLIARLGKSDYSEVLSESLFSMKSPRDG